MTKGISMTAEELQSLEKRVDRLDTKFENMLEMVNAINTNVKIIKNSCETRGAVCNEHFVNIEKKVLANQASLNGDTETDGIRTRISKLESKEKGKENLLYLVIGALLSGLFGLGIFFLQHLFSN